MGFIGWHDIYGNTKINYILFNVSSGTVPLIYLYVKPIASSSFKFKKLDWLHFSPLVLFLLYRFTIYIYDSARPGFNEVQNGTLKITLDEPLPITTVLGFAQALLYLAFTLRLLYNHRKKIDEFFSNNCKLELN